MKNKLFQIACTMIGLSAFAGVALANPITSVLTEARQVAGTMHVEIRLYEHGDLYCDSEQPCVVPIKILRDDSVELSPDAQTTSTDNVDGGSGLDTYFGQRFCDCNVPAGEHTWYLQIDEDTESLLRSRYLDFGAFLTVTDVEETDETAATSPCVDYCAPAPSIDGDDEQDAEPESEADAADGDAPADGDEVVDGDSDSDDGSDATGDNDDGGCAATHASAKWLLALLALFTMTFYTRKRSMR